MTKSSPDVVDVELTLPALFEDAKRTVEPDGKTISIKSDDGSIMVHGEDVKCFMRNAITKYLKTGQTQHRRVLVGELDGVRCYYDGETVVMTRDNLRL